MTEELRERAIKALESHGYGGEADNVVGVVFSTLGLTCDDDAFHVYLSTGCLHGDHEYCQSSTGLSGQKKPASCKFCGTECLCSCHTN